MFFEVVPSGTHYDFLGRRRIAFVISGVLLLLSIGAALVEGVRLGIDFAGGTEVQLRFDPGVGVDEGAIRTVASACGIPEADVVRYGEAEAQEYLIRFGEIRDGDGAPDGTACPIPEDVRRQIEATDAAVGGEAADPGTAARVDRMVAGLRNAVGAVEVLRVEYVGPRVGDELREDGMKAIGIACLLVLVYIAFRFSSRFAPGAVVALVHDIGITAGIFVLFQIEFDLRVLAALLAILGYSLNDTIIIYDRIRENMQLHTTFDLEDVLNRSVNQTLSRSLLTSGTTLVAVLALLFVGGSVIWPFALAMAIGIVVGTYSSVFIAAPTLLYLERRYGGGQKGAPAKGGHPKSANAPKAKKRDRGGKAARAGL